MNNNVTSKSLVSLAVPIFFELLLVIAVGNIDTIMLRYYSDAAVAAVGGIYQVLNIQNTAFGFVNLAVGILCAQFLGAGNKEKIKQIITVGVIFNLILGIVVGLAYIIFWQKILTLSQFPSELISIGKNYFLMVGGMCIFQAITLLCGAIMKSHGNPTQMLYVNIIVNLLNIIGNAIFIFGWFGIPVLGTDGVGISTVVSRAIGAIIAFLIMCKYCDYKFSLKFITPFPVKIMKNIFAIGFPTATENLAWNLGQIFILSFVNLLDISTIAARTYLMLITTFIMTFSIALGHATAIQIGQLVGARETEKAYRKCWRSLIIGFIMSFGITLTIIIFKKPVMEIFTNSTEIIDISAKVFPFMLLLEVGRVTNIMIVNALHAAGDIQYPMFVGITFIFIIAVPFSYILGIKLGMGLVGIWIANSIDEWIRSVLMYFRWKSKKWKSKSFV